MLPEDINILRDGLEVRMANDVEVQDFMERESQAEKETDRLVGKGAGIDRSVVVPQP